MNPIELLFVSITRLETGNTTTEVYTDSAEAGHNFLQLCAWNQAEFKKVSFNEDGYQVFAEGWSRQYYIRISFLLID